MAEDVEKARKQGDYYTHWSPLKPVSMRKSPSRCKSLQVIASHEKKKSL
jgi:hypothetical protein